MLDIFAKAFFLKGMKDALKVTVMNAKPATLKAAIEKAMEAEQVRETANQVKNKISELAEMEDGDLGATHGLEVECPIPNWAIRVQFPPGAINFSLVWVLCRGHLFTRLITWVDL
jgi:hypothetical protein